MKRTQAKHMFIFGLAAIGALAVLVALSVVAIILQSAKSENPHSPIFEASSPPSEVYFRPMTYAYAHASGNNGSLASSSVAIVRGAEKPVGTDPSEPL